MIQPFHPQSTFNQGIFGLVHGLPVFFQQTACIHRVGIHRPESMMDIFGGQETGQSGQPGFVIGVFQFAAPFADEDRRGARFHQVIPIGPPTVIVKCGLIESGPEPGLQVDIRAVVVGGIDQPAGNR